MEVEEAEEDEEEEEEATEDQLYENKRDLGWWRQETRRRN